MTVETIIASQQEFATTAVTSADTFLDKLSDIASSSFFVMANTHLIPSPGYTYDTTADTQALLLGLFPSDLAASAIVSTAPSFTPTVVSSASLDAVAVPDFGTAAPALDMPVVPSTVLPIAPNAPSITDPVLPSSPVLSLPVAPVVAGISFPTVPSVDLPVFSTTLPIDDLVTPTNSFTFFEELYTSALLDELNEKLLDNLENGGYGIEPADESALWDRARSRELEGALAESDALLSAAAARGFPYPPGDLNVALQKAHQDLQDRVSTANRDIALKRADLYVQNRQFTIEQSRQLEQVLIGFHSSRMERALNAAKAVLDASIQIFNANVARYNARVAAYSADGQVFEARVRAQLAQVEIYRVQMEGKRIEVDVQRAQVEVYNAQLSGVRLVVDIYTAQLNAAQVQAGIERLRIEAFRALVDAYTAQVQAKVAEFNMFEAQIKGEVARMQAFESEVRAYTATVEGAKAKAEILIARLKAQIEVAGQGIDTYKAQIEAYKADISAQAQTIDARVRTYGAQVQGAAAKSVSVGEAYRLDVTKKDLEFRRNVENARLAVEDAKIMLGGLVASADSRTKAGVAAAQYYSQLIAGAINSLGTLSAKIQQE